MTIPGAEDRPLKVLLAEDDPSVRRALHRILAAQGWRVEEAEGGRVAALRWAGSSEPFDVVVSDVVMPDGDGFELYLRLRAADRRLPVVFVSGYAPRSIPGLHRILGSPDEDPHLHFLEKPFGMHDLVDRIRTAVA